MLLPKAKARYRQEMGKKLRRINWLASRCLFIDPLIHGTPNEIYKTCGSSCCKCKQGGGQRHGPYPILHVVENHKQRQVFLRKSERYLWEEAKHYQQQKRRLEELKVTCIELQKMVEEIIEKRVHELPEGK
jgi:hypothetical protein